MKRRTNKLMPGHLTGAHREAFEHAYRMFAPLAKRRGHNGKPHHNRQGHRIRFVVDLELEAGGTIEVEFTCIRGFRFEESKMGHLWNIVHPLHPEHTRNLKGRLAAYQKKLHAWNTTANQPLTFRSFSLLLAAISYDADSAMPNHQ